MIKENQNNTSFEHGGDLRRFAEHFQTRESEIIDFSSNINPLGIPDSVRALYLNSADELTHYPDPSTTELRQEITRHFPVQMENVMAGNGSMALIGLALRALAPRRVLMIEPCFSEYRRLLEQMGTEVRVLKLKEGSDFNFQLSEIIEAFWAIDLLILCHPNNPTGTALGRDALLELLNQAKRRPVFTLVDEAFADWHPNISIATEMSKESNFMVVRSLTKFFALAGIRSGFALGPSQLIAQMQDLQETWSVNRLAEKLSVAALQDQVFQEKTRGWFQNEFSWFLNSLTALEGLKVYPSKANFFLIRTPALEPGSETLFEFLGKRNIFVRAAGNFSGLNDSYYRVALRMREDNEILLQSLSEWLQSSIESRVTV